MTRKGTIQGGKLQKRGGDIRNASKKRRIGGRKKKRKKNFTRVRGRDNRNGLQKTALGKSKKGGTRTQKEKGTIHIARRREKKRTPKASPTRKPQKGGVGK